MNFIKAECQRLAQTGNLVTYVIYVEVEEFREDLLTEVSRMMRTLAHFTVTSLTELTPEQATSEEVEQLPYTSLADMYKAIERPMKLRIGLGHLDYFLVAQACELPPKLVFQPYGDLTYVGVNLALVAPGILPDPDMAVLYIHSVLQKLGVVQDNVDLMEIALACSAETSPQLDHIWVVLNDLNEYVTGSVKHLPRMLTFQFTENGPIVHQHVSSATFQSYNPTPYEQMPQSQYMVNPRCQRAISHNEVMSGGYFGKGPFPTRG